MTQPAKSQEPSMEEILASIRRIIADDDATKSAEKPEEATRAPPAPSRPVAQPAPAPRAADPSLSAAPEIEPEDAGVSDQSADIFDLTESMASTAKVVPGPAPKSEPAPMSGPAFRTIDGSFDVSYEEGPERSAAPERPAVAQRPVGEPAPQLLSNATSAAVDSAFNTLAQTVLVQNARTLEDLVREMLRPMLKAWLDDNLPGVVERLVRAEIERVSRGR